MKKRSGWPLFTVFTKRLQSYKAHSLTQWLLEHPVTLTISYLSIQIQKMTEKYIQKLLYDPFQRLEWWHWAEFAALTSGREQDAIKSSSLLLTSQQKGCADRDTSFTRFVPLLGVGDGRSRAPNLARHTVFTSGGGGGGEGKGGVRQSFLFQANRWQFGLPQFIWCGMWSLSNVGIYGQKLPKIIDVAYRPWRIFLQQKKSKESALQDLNVHTYKLLYLGNGTSEKFQKTDPPKVPPKT